MTNAERYYTDELRKKRKKSSTQRRAVAKEQELFMGVVEYALKHSEALAKTAQVLAEIDLFFLPGVRL